MVLSKDIADNQNTDAAENTVLVGSIQKFSTEDGPGIRTTVFFKGCPLACRWCHNPEMIDPDQQLIFTKSKCIGCGHCIGLCPNGAISADPEEGIVIDRDRCGVCLRCASECWAGALRPVAREMTVEEIIEKVAQDKEFYESTGGGITLSGGEILTHGTFIGELIDAAAERGIDVCLDTCGHWDAELLMSLAARPNVTDVLYDLKSPDNDIHKEYTGVGNSLILSNMKKLAEDPVTAPKLNIRMPLVAGVTDTDEQIRKAGELFADLRIRKATLLPYHDLGRSKKRNIGGEQELFEAPSEDRIEEIAAYLEDASGVSIEVLGRV